MRQSYRRTGGACAQELRQSCHLQKAANATPVIIFATRSPLSPLPRASVTDENTLLTYTATG